MTKKIEFSREVVISLISVIIGSVLTLASTVGYDTWKNYQEDKKLDINLSRQLLGEIRYNLKIGQLAEITEKEVTYKIERWMSYESSTTYYKLPKDVGRSLDTIYSIWRLKNDGQLLLGKKDPSVLKVTDLGRLVLPFFDYLKKNKIIGDEEKSLVDWRTQDFGLYNPDTATFKRELK